MPPHRTTTVAASRLCESLLRLRQPRSKARPLSVLGVYRSALNLQRPDGTLVTVAVERVGGLPCGILVRDIDDLRALGVAPGMRATIGVGSVTVGTTLRIDLAAAHPWRAAIGQRDITAWRERAPRVRQVARALRSPDGLGATPGASSALQGLGDAIVQGDRPGLIAAADRLIGLGPGLTPSGDDALAGVEAALHVAGHPLAGSVADALYDLDRRTTTVSAAMLRHAVRGDVAERIHGLLDVVLGPVSGDLLATLREAVAWGATSGADTLAGVLVGLDAATANLERRQAA